MDEKPANPQQKLPGASDSLEFLRLSIPLGFASIVFGGVSAGLIQISYTIMTFMTLARRGSRAFHPLDLFFYLWPIATFVVFILLYRASLKRRPKRPFQFNLTTLLLVTAAVSVLVAIPVWYEQAKRARTTMLDEYRSHIESTYTQELVLIEKRATELPHPDDPSAQANGQFQAIISELEETLAKPEIFSAGWSTDGHHGMWALKPMEGEGCSTSTWVISRDASGLHTLSCGETFQAKELLVYEGWVPKGVNQSYWIAFYRSAIVAAAETPSGESD